MKTLIRRPKSLFPTIVTDFLNGDSDLLDLSTDILNPDWGIRRNVPSANVTERERDFLIEVAAPGMEKKDFKVELENNTISISAEKEEKKEEKENGNTRKEFSYNSFCRCFTLPENSKVDKISSKYENGILSIEIPKKEVTVAKAAKQIAVL